MDRIRKALDMARQQRDLGSDPKSDARATRVSRMPTVLPADIIYTETQVFRPDPGTIEANRIVNPSSRSGRGSRGLIVGLRSEVGSRSTVMV